MHDDSIDLDQADEDRAQGDLVPLTMPNLQTILAKDADGVIRLWACRGSGRGCSRNHFRGRKAPCQDCMLARDDETLRELKTRLRKGDA